MSYWKSDDGSQIYYEVFGPPENEKVLLLLPGLLGAVNSQWKEFVTPLSKRYRVILADLRGHGRSENNASGLLPDRMAQDMCGLLDNLGHDSVYLAGYNLGGYLGLILHMLEPRRVRTVLMHGTKFYWTEQAAAAMVQQLDPDTMGERVPAYADQLAMQHGAGRWRSLVRQAADLVVYMSTNGLSESVAFRAQCPILVSVGDRDELVPVREAQRLSRGFQQGALLVLPGVRHPFQSLGLVPMLQVMMNFHR